MGVAIGTPPPEGGGAGASSAGGGGTERAKSGDDNRGSSPGGRGRGVVGSWNWPGGVATAATADKIELTWLEDNFWLLYEEASFSFGFFFGGDFLSFPLLWVGDNNGCCCCCCCWWPGTAAVSLEATARETVGKFFDDNNVVVCFAGDSNSLGIGGSLLMASAFRGLAAPPPPTTRLLCNLEMVAARPPPLKASGRAGVLVVEAKLPAGVGGVGVSFFDGALTPEKEATQRSLTLSLIHI